MNTAERAAHLAAAAARFPFLGPTSAEDLLELVRLELGHAGILDDFQTRGTLFARAAPLPTLLHVLSGNTPAAGLQTLIRGLLLGAHNLCKVPSVGLPEIAEFHAALPPELASHLEISTVLPDEWLARADAVIVFGRDETIAQLRGRLRAQQTFLPYGHKLSLGIVFEDPAFMSTAAAARDASVFDQLGCLSPQVFYVRGDAQRYAERLAEAMERFAELNAGSPRHRSDAVAIRSAREELAFRAANGEPIALWQSAGSTTWTVVFDDTSGFPRSPLHRFVYVKPLPTDLGESLREVRPHMSTAGIWPATLANARFAAELGVTRICELGRMQLPPWTWHQDGQPVLAPLVRWIDAEVST